LKVYQVFQEEGAGAMLEIVANESRMLKEWSHPCVVKGFGMKPPEDQQSNAILAMEFMEKGSIDRCIGCLSPEQKVLAILRAVLALEFVHSKGVIHGDIKPSNLLIDGECNAKLSDFGASRTADGSMTTNVGNTAAYAPAEVLQGGRPTVKSDVYSLGLLMYFVITGRHAFDPELPPMRLMDAVKAGAKVELPRSVKPELSELIRSMCSSEAEERPRSAKAVFDAICESEFGFFEGIDAVEVRVALAKLGVRDPFES
jgi:serine/threonine protein kinase